MNLSTQELTIIGTLAGAFIGGFFGFMAAWLSKRSEERKAFKELIVRVASEQYMHDIDAALKTRGKIVMPYQIYLIEILELTKIINKRFLTPKRVVKLLKRSNKIIDAIILKVKERTKQMEKQLIDVP